MDIFSSFGFVRAVVVGVALGVCCGVGSAGAVCDLEVELVASTGQTHEGGLVAFVVEVRNSGPDVAEGVELLINAPESHPWAPWELWSPENWWGNAKRLGPGESVNFGYLCVPEAGLISPSGKWRIDATVSSLTLDDNVGNNVAAVEVSCADEGAGRTDLSLSRISAPRVVELGVGVDYVYRLTNHGDVVVENGYVAFAGTPACAMVTGAVIDRGFVVVTDWYCHVLGVNLAPGESMDLTFQVLPVHVGLFSAVAGVGGEVYDGNVVNNYVRDRGVTVDSIADQVDLSVSVLKAKVKKKFKKKQGRWKMNVNGKVRVTKTGPALKSGDYQLKVYLSDDAVRDEGDREIYSWTGWVSSIGVQDLSFKVPVMWPVKEFDQHMIVEITPLGVDLDEGNNSVVVFLP